YGAWQVESQATEIQEGRKYHDCLACGYRQYFTIKKQTHAHQYDWSWSADTILAGANNRYHWQECLDTDCAAVAGKGVPQFGSWTAISYAGPNTEGVVYRTCEACGYQQDKQTPAGRYQLLAYNGTTLVRAVVIDPSRDPIDIPIRAKVPDGYRFTAWESLCTGDYTIEFKDPGSPDTTMKVIRDLHASEKRDSYAPIVVEAKLERLDNYLLVDYMGKTLKVYPNQGLLRKDTGIKKAGEVIDAAKGDYDLALFVDDSHEDIYGMRTLTVYLNNYNGGRITLYSRGLPCNLEVVCEGTVNCISSGEYGILGNNDGGYVRVSSEDESSLYISVSDTWNDPTGICSRSEKSWIDEEVILAGNVDVHITSTATYPNSQAYGLYSSKRVSVLDEASLQVDCLHTSSQVTRKTAATAIYAKRQAEINTQGSVNLNTYQLKDQNALGIPVQSTNFLINGASRLNFIYPARQNKAWRADLVMDESEYILHEYKKEMKKLSGAAYNTCVLELEPGYRVQLSPYFKDDVILQQLTDWREENGVYMVPAGEEFRFTLTPITSEAYTMKGECSINNAPIDYISTEDGVTYEYSIPSVREDSYITQHVSHFSGFDSSPFPASQTVKTGTEFQYSWTIRPADATAMWWQKKVSPTTDTKVHLQRLDAELGWVECGSADLTDSGSATYLEKTPFAEGDTTVYRLALRFNNREFTSGEFKVTWTEDPTLSRVPSVNAVEVYTRLATSPLYREQAAWLRLDSKTPRLVFDGRYGTYRTAKKNEGSLEAKLISIAVLDPDTGTLTLKGDSVTGTIDGVKRTLDCSEILGAIRVPEADSVHGATALGRLKLVLQGDTTLSMDYNEAFWMISTAGNASREDTEAAILTNRYGDILITSDAPACLNIWNRADEEGITQNGKWYGRTIYGIQGYETVTVSGNTMVSIDLQGDYIGGNNKALTRVGISGNSIVLEDKANLSIDLPGLEARGGTVGLEGGSEDILLKGQSHLNITADGTPTNVAAESRYYGIQTDGCFRMEGNSSLYLSVTGDWVTGIQANDGISLQSEGAAIVDAYNNGPYGGHGVALQSNGDLNLDNGGRVVLFYDVENGSLWEDSVPALHEDDHVCYEEISQRKGSLKILSGKGADLTIHSDESDETEKPLISVSPQENLTAILLSGYELSVRAGDTVKVTMPSDTGIYTFRGWEAEGTLPADWKAEDRSVSFTMPAEGLELKPILTCELFPNQPYLLQEDNSETGRLWWSAAHNINQYWLFAVKLQKWVYNWYDQEWGWQDQFDLLEADMDSSGSETAPVCGWIQVSRSGQRALEDGEYRLAAVMKDGDSFKTYPGQSFELNWGQTSAFTAAAGCSTADTASYLSHGRGDVHVALAGLDIPAGYVGEDYSVDVSSLLRPVGTAFRYEASLRDSSSSLSQTGIVDFSITEDGRLYLYRRAAHDAIQASAGTCVVTATDLFTGAKIHMYFSLGEIRARSQKDYGLFVAGTCVNEYNKDDVLGDGTVSYNPLTHTLTLKEADLNGAYAVQGEDFAAACGIYSQMGGTLVIRLEGSNTITVTNGSPCRGMNYSIRGLDKLGIGSFRSTRFSTSPDSILIEGSGTLNIQVPENNSCGIYATSVYLKSGSVSIHSGMTGICATYGAVENSGAKLQVMSAAAGIEVLDGVPTYGISLNKGDVTIEAGSYALASYSGQKIYLWNDHIVLKAKNPDGQVALGEITSAVDGLIELQKTLGGDKTLWNGTDSLSDAVSLETDSYFPVAVNGQRFRYNQRTIACGSGSATYKPDSHTLVLSNAEITDSTEVTPGNPAAIYVKGSTALTIRLEGENSIRLKSVPYPKESYGFYGSSLSLSGDGSLTISKAVKGIRATEQLTVSGGHTSIEATQQAVYTPELKVRGGILEANNTLNAWLDFGVDPSEEPVAIYTGSCAEDAEFYNYAALGHPDADYIRLEGAYPAAVNGIPFSVGHLTIPCGQGSAVYDPALNTITLTNAQITQGCSLVQGGDTLFTGLYVKDHAYLRLVGDSRIDISGSESPVYGAAGADETDFASSLAGTGSVEIYGNGSLTMTAPDGIKLEASASSPGTLVMRAGCVASQAGSYANRLAQLDYYGGSLTLISAVKDAETFRIRDLAPLNSYTLSYSANSDGSQGKTGTLADISGQSVPYLVITGANPHYTLMDVSRLFRYLTGQLELTEEEKHFYDCDGSGKLSLKDVSSMFNLVSR
ncbi:MAG: carbohydrate-binding domain-containing protein, partial [Oscillospiraceae bacterium]|nr:carbohydrate-binding domain-containing protein [Oscillospiraceae bacterium]